VNRDTTEVLSDATALVLAVSTGDAKRALAVLDDLKQETIKLKSLEADLAGTQAKAAALAEERKAFESAKIVSAGEIESARVDIANEKQALARKRAEHDAAVAAHTKTVAAFHSQVDEVHRLKSVLVK
jgi:hypothetical protein